jgi:type VI secretion system protein ImpC
MAEQNLSVAQEADGAQTEENNLLDSIINDSHMVREESQRTWAKEIITEFAKEVMEGQIKVSKNTEAMINARIAELDRMISAQLNEIMHDEAFQKLEGSWRGLNYLVQQTETGERMKIKVMNVTKKELLKDMEKASEFDQSVIFKKVYEEEFGMFGGHSYGVILGDYEFGFAPQDMALLEKISGVAAAAHAPFISAVSPKMFNWESFTELGGPREIAKIFTSAEYTKWKSFRQSEDSRYVGLTLPRILMRLPYGSSTIPVEDFNFEEDVDGTDHKKYLWGNAAFALATRMTDAFAKYGWCAAIRGVEGGGLVSGLPSHTFKTDEGEIALKCPTEIAITDRREKEFADMGFIPLVHCKGTDYAAFFSAQSTNKPKLYDSDLANANARLSSQLQYIMAVSRFAHYLKAMMRDKIGSFMSRPQAERFLNNWISKYVVLDDHAGAEIKARHPLREARIEVSDIPGKPGAYKAVAFLRPHYQLDELTVSLRLVAELPPPASK